MFSARKQQSRNEVQALLYADLVIGILWHASVENNLSMFAA